MSVVAVGSNGSFGFVRTHGFYFGDDVDYEKIMIGRLDIVALAREVEALRNEVDFLKESLSRVLAQESLREVEEIIAEENNEH